MGIIHQMVDDPTCPYVEVIAWRVWLTEHDIILENREGKLRTVPVISQLAEEGEATDKRDHKEAKSKCAITCFESRSQGCRRMNAINLSKID